MELAPRAKVQDSRFHVPTPREVVGGTCGCLRGACFLFAGGAWTRSFAPSRAQCRAQLSCTSSDKSLQILSKYRRYGRGPAFAYSQHGPGTCALLASKVLGTFHIPLTIPLTIPLRNNCQLRLHATLHCPRQTQQTAPVPESESLRAFVHRTTRSHQEAIPGTYTQSRLGSRIVSNCIYSILNVSPSLLLPPPPATTSSKHRHPHSASPRRQHPPRRPQSPRACTAALSPQQSPAKRPS